MPLQGPARAWHARSGRCVVAWWRWRTRDGAGVDEWRARVEDLESRLAFVNDRHERLLAQEGEPMRENVVLRYDLQRCQRDRLVLEAHLAATRGELRLARGVARRASPTGAARERALAAAARDLALQVRALGGDATAAAAVDACAAPLAPEPPDPVVILAGACDALLDAFEGWRDEAFSAHDSPAAALASLDPATEALRQAVAALRRDLASDADPP